MQFVGQLAAAALPWSVYSSFCGLRQTDTGRRD